MRPPRTPPDRTPQLLRQASNIAGMLLLLLLLTAPLCRAQAVATASGPGSHVSLGAGISWFQQDYAHRYIGGGYASAEIYPQWRFALVGEARLLRLHTSQQVTESTYLTGVHVNVRPGSHQVEPYLKALAGAGRITLPYHYAYGTFFTYAGGGGIDIALSDHVTLRPIDIEYQRWDDFPFGNLRPYGISAGIRVRLNPMRRLPH